uniref:hypothetical protein n=1 Tax=Saccharothrix mutabilis TaxID=33921 RepID=UPI0031D3D4AE
MIRIDVSVTSLAWGGCEDVTGSSSPMVSWPGAEVVDRWELRILLLVRFARLSI